MFPLHVPHESNSQLPHAGACCVRDTDGRGEKPSTFHVGRISSRSLESQAPSKNTPQLPQLFNEAQGIRPHRTANSACPHCSLDPRSSPTTLFPGGKAEGKEDSSSCSFRLHRCPPLSGVASAESWSTSRPVSLSESLLLPGVFVQLSPLTFVFPVSSSGASPNSGH